MSLRLSRPGGSRATDCLARAGVRGTTAAAATARGAGRASLLLQAGLLSVENAIFVGVFVWAVGEETEFAVRETSAAFVGDDFSRFCS